MSHLSYVSMNKPIDDTAGTISAEISAAVEIT